LVIPSRRRSDDPDFFPEYRAQQDLVLDDSPMDAAIGYELEPRLVADRPAF